MARLPLDSAAAGSHHVSQPDGVPMGLCIGMGQDGILLHWARWDGERLTGWDLDERTDRILVDVHAAHPGFLTVEHYGTDLELHALDGAVLAEGIPEPADDEDAPCADDEGAPCWDYGCGFVDAGTVIASTAESDEDPERARDWLLDAGTLEIRGAVRYPTGPAAKCARSATEPGSPTTSAARRSTAGPKQCLEEGAQRVGSDLRQGYALDAVRVSRGLRRHTARSEEGKRRRQWIHRPWDDVVSRRSGSICDAMAGRAPLPPTAVTPAPEFTHFPGARVIPVGLAPVSA
ncbi:hypothetical protein ABZ471_38630 [Streptomyces sp. NPDC005728]|uniref:hypothetical protein n=1 Tax=Streptomyces sp. NPDC005728 TaxID=3157054 RepID=UPI0033F938C8